MTTAQNARTTYRVKADSIEACNCQHGCNCQFLGYPNDGKCEFIIGFQVKDGRVGDISLNGLRAAIAAKYPKAIHDGNGHVVLFIDESASDEQVAAFAALLSGQLGGMPWEALQVRSASSKDRLESRSKSPSPARNRPSVSPDS